MKAVIKRLGRTRFARRMDRTFIPMSTGLMTYFVVALGHSVAETYTDLPSWLDVLVYGAALTCWLITWTVPPKPKVKRLPLDRMVGMSTKQALLLEQITSGSGPRYAAVATLWEDIYGKPIDYDRPLATILNEIGVALKAKQP